MSSFMKFWTMIRPLFFFAALANVSFAHKEPELFKLKLYSKTAVVITPDDVVPINELLHLFLNSIENNTAPNENIYVTDSGQETNILFAKSESGVTWHGRVIDYKGIPALELWNLNYAEPHKKVYFFLEYAQSLIRNERLLANRIIVSLDKDLARKAPGHEILIDFFETDDVQHFRGFRLIGKRPPSKKESKLFRIFLEQIAENALLGDDEIKVPDSFLNSEWRARFHEDHIEFFSTKNEVFTFYFDSSMEVFDDNNTFFVPVSSPKSQEVIDQLLDVNHGSFPKNSSDPFVGIDSDHSLIARNILELHELLIAKWKLEKETFESEAKALSEGTQSQEIADRFLSERVKQGFVSVSTAAGTGELKHEDGYSFFRFTHAASEWSVLFVPKTSFDPNSPKQRSYLATQVIDSGSGRADGKIGRDLFVFEMDDILNPPFQQATPSTFHYFRNERSITNPSYRFHWRHATVVPGETLMFSKAAIYTSIQSVASYLASLTKESLAPLRIAIAKSVDGILQYMGFDNNEIDGAIVKGNPANVTVVNGIWSSTIGTMGTAYNNFMNRGSYRTRFWKKAIQGYIYTYTLKLGDIGFEGFANLFSPTLGNLAEHALLSYNVLATKGLRVHLDNVVKIRKELGLNRRKLVHFDPLKWIPGLAGRRPFILRQYEIEAALAYTPYLFLKVLTVLFPAGNFLWLIATPAAEYGVLRYLEYVARSTNIPKAVEMATKARHDWELHRAFYTNKRLRRLSLKRIFFKFTFQHNKLKETTNELFDSFGGQLKALKKIKEKNKPTQVKADPRNLFKALSCRNRMSSAMEKL